MTLKDLLKDELPWGRFWNKRWHLVSGCKEVSPGCAGCWLRSEARLRQHNEKVKWLHDGLLTDDGKAWNGTVRCNERLLNLPQKRRKPTAYAIWSDLFHESVPNSFRDRAFAVMAQAVRHRFIIVTKRPDVAQRYFCSSVYSPVLAGLQPPLSNIVILVTMEDQQRADERIPHAAQLASMGWQVGLLCEPLLGPVSFRWAAAWPENAPTTAQNPYNGGATNELDGLRRFAWLIAGGESGASARPVFPAWVQALRDQTQAAGVPFLFKQWGEYAPFVRVVDTEKRAIVEKELPDGRVARLGKSESGRRLDGQLHLEVPAI